MPATESAERALRPGWPARPEAAAALLALVLAACGDGAPTVGPSGPSWVLVTPDTVRMTYFGERARVHASVGPEQPAGTKVKWTSTDRSVFTVDADGEVTAVANGFAVVVAELGGVRDSAVVWMRQVANRLKVLNGGQRGGAGLPLRERVGVRVLDAGGSRVVSYQPRVRFDASADGGRANPAEVWVWAGRDGVGWTTWTLGPAPGPQALAVTVSGVSGEIGAVGIEPDSVVVAVAAHSGEGQGAPAGEPLSEPVVVAVLDELGRRVPGATVRFEPAAGNGRADPAETASDSAGLARTVWTLGEAPGPQTLVASPAKGASVEIGATAQSDEGVCARTPAVADEIVRQAGAANCAEVTEVQLAAIRQLYLGGRGIRRLGSGDFAGLAKLRALLLDENELEELPPDLLAGLQAVSHVWLQGNRLESLPPDLFTGLAKLRVLWLDRNRLEELPPGVFADLSSLRKLRLSDNRLAALRPDVFAEIPELTDLGLAFNELEALPPGIFDGLSRLGYLYLNDNRLAELPPDVFGGLSNLVWLRLQFNDLTSLPPGVFDGLSRLSELRLEHNEILELRAGIFDDLERLVRLELVGNRPLAELPPDVFAGTPNLERLDMDVNDLAELRPGVFGGLPKLRHVSLRWNELAGLPPGVFAGLGALEEFYVEGNPGVPFPVVAELERVDTIDVLAPGPARVVMRVPSGAPFALRMPVSVQGGAASAGWLEVGAGDTASAPLVVERPSASAGPVHLSFGQPPGLPPTYFGLEVAAGEQMALFAAAANRTPVFRAQLPPHWMQAGGGAVALELAPYFSDPDGDVLAYAVETSDGSVAGGRVEGGVLWLEPLAEGEAELEVAASDAGGLMASQRVLLTVAPAADPDRFNIHLLFAPGFSERHKEVVRRAAERWEEVVVGDLPDVPIDGYLDNCGLDTGRRLVGIVDDLVIQMYPNSQGFAEFSIAGDCGNREASGLAFHGAVWYGGQHFEPGYDRWELFYRITLHEFGHVLGIGSNEWLRRVRPFRQGDKHFPGPLAIEAFNAAGGLAHDGPKVPVQNIPGTGGPIHWRLNMFAGEIMGRLGNALSAITVQALADLGHGVDVSKADPYTPGLALGGAAAGAAAADGAGQEEFMRPDSIRRLPVVVVDENGKVVRVIRN